MNTAFLCSKYAWLIMKKQKNGQIINISSNLGKIIIPEFGAYGSAKAALEHFSKVLALELNDFGIKVNTLSPSGSIKIKKREFNKGLDGGDSKEMVGPVVKLCLSDITGKSSPNKIYPVTPK